MNLRDIIGLTLVLALSLAAPGIGPQPARADWQPAKGPLTTRWAKDVSPDKVHPEYPRPQMVRQQWTNLNGLWDYAITPKDAATPDKWDGQILVPFAVESALSGVMKKVGPDNRLWYHRSFKADKLDNGKRLLLHFGAVDWHAQVLINGKLVGEHKGGYTPFSLDITDAIKPGADNELIVSVWDPTDANWQPRGKQVGNPGGIWYTSVTGIWQTVWMETVPKMYITHLTITPDFDQKSVHVTVHAEGGDATAKVIVQTDDYKLAAVTAPAGKEVTIPIPDVRAWSPDKPFLYNLSVVLEPTNDVVTSYFGMRKIEVKKDVDGFNRLFLNNEPVFQVGPLDQGWWPDGLYTAPTDEALRYDIEMTRKLGYNMCRKHVKVEPERWYYWCDKLGLLVWQDMPNGDRHIAGKDPDIDRSAESEANYRREWTDIIHARRNHPCIVVWVPFNEGWGQFKTNEILAFTRQLDPTRLVDGPSGWTDRGEGDMHDMHRYPGPGMPDTEDKRAAVLGEFGGLGLPLEGHLWQDKKNWGYRTFQSREELQNEYEQLIRRLRPLIGRGLSAAVYTQTTDVEGEVNGLMTYDREMTKFDVNRMARAHARLFGAQPILVIKTIVPTSQEKAQTWKYTTEQPDKMWMYPAFDDSKWTEGPGGFGEPSTPGSVVRTKWKTDDIWLRRTFDLTDAGLEGPQVRIHHDEDCEVYINGQIAIRLHGFVTEYIDEPFSAAAQRALKQGTNVIAIHCHQTGGGQYIDAGVIDVTEKLRTK